MEKPVTFKNRNGSTLFGMLYVPEDAASRRVGIIISVNAIKYRLGTFRLHVLLARKLCNLGYTVFTFDPEGIGDSEGVFDYKLLSEHYYDIQTGKYDFDLSDAVGYFTSQVDVRSVVLFGLCGGAISVLMEAATDARVHGLILLNLPVLVEDLARKGEVDNAAKIISSETATNLLKGKLRRLSEPDFWRRLLLLRVDIREEARLVRRSLSVVMKKVLEKAESTLHNGRPAPETPPPASAHPLFNVRFQPSLSRVVLSEKPVLFIFAELDPWTWIFKSEFQDTAMVPGSRFERGCQIVVIERANHIFSSRESQESLQSCIEAWLAKPYHATGSMS